MADVPQASLLGIPVEIRQMILSYLMPDLHHIPHRAVPAPIRPPWGAEHDGPNLAPTPPPAAQDDRDVDDSDLHSLDIDRPATEDPDADDLDNERLEEIADDSDIEYLEPIEPDRTTQRGLLRYDGEPCHPSILLVNHQIYEEGIALLYSVNTYGIEITKYEVLAFGENLWAKWHPCAPRFTEHTLDSRFERIRNFAHVKSPNVAGSARARRTRWLWQVHLY